MQKPGIWPRSEADVTEKEKKKKNKNKNKKCSGLTGWGLRKVVRLRQPGREGECTFGCCEHLFLR